MITELSRTSPGRGLMAPIRRHATGLAADLVLAALVLLALAPAAPAQADGLEAGMWRVLNRPVINGIAGPEQPNMRCLTPEAVADLDKSFSPISRTTNSECEMVEHDATPQHVKWHLQCKGQMDMDVAGEFVFEAPDHYTATIDTKMSALGRPLQSTHLTLDARRVGECQ
jgi:hypothetical protein